MSSTSETLLDRRSRTETTAVTVMAIAGLLLAVVLYNVEFRRGRDNCLQRLTHVGLAAVETDAGDRSVMARLDRFRNWAWAATADDAVLGAALFDENGALLDVIPPDLVSARDANKMTVPGAYPLAVDDHIGPVEFHSHGRRTGLRVVIVSRVPPALVLPIHGWTPIASVGCMTLTVIILRWCLRVSFAGSIYLPIKAILDTTRRLEFDPDQSRTTHRLGEIGEIARNLDRLIAEREKTHSHLGHMSRTVDQRVAVQTRRIELMLKRAEKQAWVDALTGLGNRRLLDDRLEELFDAQVEQNQDLAIVQIDLDNFKTLNDTLGHAAGDEVLSFVGELLRGTLRPSDVGLRCGGDEFTVILLDTGSAEAARMAERLIKLFSQKASLYKSRPPVSMSAGVASLQEHKPDNGYALMDLADRALYQSKFAGKASVRIASKDPVYKLRTTDPVTRR